MTLQELRFIIALAQHKHFRKAAAACFVSQPTLSIAIRKLEKELGVTLFERQQNDVAITALGQQVVERARCVITAVDGIKEAVLQDPEQLQYPLKIGAIYTVGPHLFPALIMHMRTLAPSLPLEIHESYTGDLRQRLLAGDLDAVIVALPFTATGIVTHRLYDEPFVVLMPADHPLTQHKSISDKALSEYPLLMLGEGHCLRDQIMSSCPLCFTKTDDALEAASRTIDGASLETLRHMVAANMGLTILPQTMVRLGAYPKSVLVTRPLKVQGPERTIAVAWRKSFPRTKAIDLLLKALVKASQ